MLKKTITYEDFNGETVSEDFFFHLSKAELVELELSHKGGLAESIQKIIDAEDGKQIIAEFKNIILGAYGKRSDDGKRFIKNQALREEFESTEAYSVLFMEVVTETDKAIEFVNGIVPKGLKEEAAKITGADLSVVPEPEPTPLPLEPVILHKVDIAKMSNDEIAQLGPRIASGEVKLEPEDEPQSTA